jgi:hypothetical protein
MEVSSPVAVCDCCRIHRKRLPPVRGEIDHGVGAENGESFGSVEKSGQGSVVVGIAAPKRTGTVQADLRSAGSADCKAPATARASDGVENSESGADVARA